MVYSSVIFLFYFLPIVLVVYYLLPNIRLKNAFLLLASMVFYAWGEGKLLILLLAVGFSAWAFSYLIAKTKYKKQFVYIAVITYILVLIYYKYLGFIISNFIFTRPGELSEFSFVMPIGVSFFCFQAISYVLDVYRKNKSYEKNPAYVLLYITMFPQLISGPLVSYTLMAQQLKARHSDFESFTEGIRRFIIGLAKKVLIANPLGLLVAEIMKTDIHLIGPSVAWIGIITFTLQLYFDFSGYTDMAIGAGKMLGFDLPENFNYPYISKSITEFWRRWHMTLSGWLREYVFIPLTLNFRHWRKTGVFIALMITFTLCGIWHSPGWNFLIWGAIHGLFLGIEQLFLGKHLVKLKSAAIIYTLFVIVTSFVFVRIEGFYNALNYLGVMFSPAGLSALGPEAFLANQHIALIIISIVFCMPLPKISINKNKYLSEGLQVMGLFFLIVIFLLSAMAITSETYNPFLYFKF